MANQEQTAAEKGQRPIDEYLKLPSSDEEEAYLIGSRCRNCREAYLGKRVICLNCYEMDQMEEIALSRTGEIFTYTVVYQSAPWVQVPFVAAVIKLTDGPVVKATMVGVQPKPEEEVKVGMRVQMVTEKVRQDSNGNDIIAYKFKPM